MGAIAPPPAYADTQAPGMYHTEKKSIGWYFVHFPKSMEFFVGVIHYSYYRTFEPNWFRYMVQVHIPIESIFDSQMHSS